jgi:hypothetical protein
MNVPIYSYTGPAAWNSSIRSQITLEEFKRALMTNLFDTPLSIRVLAITFRPTVYFYFLFFTLPMLFVQQGQYSIFFNNNNNNKNNDNNIDCNYH